MASFGEAFRVGRAEARAARGAPPLERRNTLPASDLDLPIDDAGQPPAHVAELEAALREREGEVAEIKQLLAEMTDYAEKMQDRVVELVAAAEPMAKVLRLPGVKTFLLQKFHPDRYPDADDRQREMLTEAIKTITAAYALAGQLQTSD